MLNSLTVFLAFCGFLLFGYLSLVRLLAKRAFAATSNHGFFKQVGFTKLLRDLGSSALFVSLPATSLLLFWGWGPALIWLLVFHLLIESTFHLQYSVQQDQYSIADFILRSEHRLMAAIEQGMVQAFFLLSMSMVVALLATLVDRQPGLLFAIVALLPARRLMSHGSAAVPWLVRALGSIGILALGLVFSDQLGFSLYGDWAPFEQKLPWLVFNMPTLLAGILVVAVFQLERNTGFKNDLSTFTGVIVLLLLVTMIARLIWLQPILDAPLNSTQLRNENLPLLWWFCLFISAGFCTFLVRVLNEEDNQTSHSPTQFTRLQTGSIIHLLFLVTLVLSLAAAMGIGSWKTHYLVWSNELNLLDFLNLAISSTLNLIDSQAVTGTLVHTILLAALCFAGFSFLLMCADQLTVEEAEKETMWSLVIESKVLQAIVIFILSAYLISHGISLDVWLLIGMLGWVLFTHLIIGLCLHSDNTGLFPMVALLIMIAGYVQAGYVMFQWALSGKLILLGCAGAILLLTTFLWFPSLKQLRRQIDPQEDEPLL